LLLSLFDCGKEHIRVELIKQSALSTEAGKLNEVPNAGDRQPPLRQPCPGNSAIDECSFAEVQSVGCRSTCCWVSAF